MLHSQVCYMPINFKEKSIIYFLTWTVTIIEPKLLKFIISNLLAKELIYIVNECYVLLSNFYSSLEKLFLKNGLKICDVLKKILPIHHVSHVYK